MRLCQTGCSVTGRRGHSGTTDGDPQGPPCCGEGKRKVLALLTRKHPHKRECVFPERTKEVLSTHTHTHFEMHIRKVSSSTLFPEMFETNNPAFLSLFWRKGVGQSSALMRGGGGVMLVSDLAVRGQVSQGVDDFSEGGALFEAYRPAADHELVDLGGASIWNWELQLPGLQTWRDGGPAERRS